MSVDGRAGWCVMISEMISEILADQAPEDAEPALAWAARSLRDDCPDRFAPEPKVIRQGFEDYFERKAELGDDFTLDEVYAPWDPDKQTERLFLNVERAERKRGKPS